MYLLDYRRRNKVMSVVVFLMIYTIAVTGTVLAGVPNAQFAASVTKGCAPLKVEFQNNSTNAVSYQWDFGNGQTSTLLDPVIIYNLPGKYTIKLTAYNGSGGFDAETKIDFVVAETQSIADYSVVDSMLCISDETSFINQSQNATSYLWDFGDGHTSTEPNPSHKYTAAGKYNISLIARNGPSCKSSYTKYSALVVDTPPIPDFYPESTLLCKLGDTARFINTSSGATSFIWDLDDGITSTDSIASTVYASPGAKTVKLLAVTSNGCKDSLTLWKTLVQKTAKDKPFLHSVSEGCEPVIVDYDVGAPGWNKYVWYFGDGDTSTAPNSIHEFNTPGTYTSKLKIIDSDDCEYWSSDTVVVDVWANKEPNVPFETTTGCAPLALEMNNLSLPQQTIWKLSDGQIFVGNTINESIESNGVIDILVESITDKGCRASLQLDSVLIIDAPNADLLNKDYKGCQPYTASFNVTGSNIATCFWEFGNGDTSSVENPTVLFSSTGDYDVTMRATSPLGCKRDFEWKGLVHVIGVDHNIAMNEPVVSCGKIDVHFEGGKLAHSNYFWDFGDGNTSSDSNVTHAYDQPGTYEIQFGGKNQAGCPFQIQNFATVIVSDIEADFEVNTIPCSNYMGELKSLSAEADSWEWIINHSFIYHEENLIIPFLHRGAHTIQLVVEDTNGCLDKKARVNHIMDKFECPPDLAILMDPDSLNTLVGEIDDSITPPIGSNIKPLPIPSINGCAPLEVDFRNYFPDATSVYWDFDDGTTTISRDVSHVYMTQGIYSPKIVATFSDGSTDSLWFPDFIRVGGGTVAMDAVETKVCPKSEYQFNSFVTSFGHFEWNFGDGEVSHDPNPVHEYDSSGKYQVILEAFDDDGCSAKVTELVIAGNPIPMFEFPSEICAEDTVLFYHNIKGYDSYEWTSEPSMTNNGKEVIFHASGDFVPFLVAEQNGCVHEFASHDTVHVTKPSAEYILWGDTVSCDSTEINFISTGKNISSWKWSIGDSLMSTDQHFEYKFGKQGTYSSSLEVSYGGCTEKYISPFKITVSTVEANLTVFQDDLCFPVQTTLINNSVHAANALWVVGFSDTLYGDTVSYTFENNLKQVTLHTENELGCTADSTNLRPFEYFKANIKRSDDMLCAPIEVRFYDYSHTSISRIWDFGDGSTDTTRNPKHIYQDAGSYDVTLYATSPSGCIDTAVKKNFLNVKKVKADMQAIGQTGGCTPLIVDFKDNSVGSESWDWHFGDGAFSDIKDPTHIYTQPGLFEVKLIVSNSIGCTDSVTWNNKFKVDGPAADYDVSDTIKCFPATISFEEKSLYGVSREWYFGDGNTSTDLTPNHAYSSPGTYNASLLVTDSLGCSEYLNLPPIVIAETPKAAFDFTTSGTCMPVTVNVNNTSTGLNQPVFHWSLNGSIVSSSMNPSFTIANKGTYTLELGISNKYGCTDKLKSGETIMVHDTMMIQEPHVLQLTVLDDHRTSLEWMPFQHSNFKQNVIYRMENQSGVFNAIDTITDSKINSFIDNGLITKDNVYHYKIQTQTQCADPGTFSELTQYTTINVETSVDTGVVHVTWTPYGGHNFEKYMVLRKMHSQHTYEVAAIVDTSVHTWDDTSHLCPEMHEYKIVAMDLHGNSYNSYSDTSMAAPLQNLFQYQTTDIISTTVLNNAHILSEWTTPTIGPDKVLYYDIHRSVNGSDFERIELLPKGALSFLDQDVDVNANQYTYRIEIVNLCSVKGLTSNNGSSLLLTKETDQYLNHLEWNAYDEWDQGVREYKIQRLKDDGTWKDVLILPGNSTQTTIDLINE